MFKNIKIRNKNIILIGGGSSCKELLTYFLSNTFDNCRPKILGIVDSDITAIGIVFARMNGIFTCKKYENIKNRSDANLIIMTVHGFGINYVQSFEEEINIEVIDYIEAMLVIDQIRIEEIEKKIIKKLEKEDVKEEKIIHYFKEYSSKVKKIVAKENNRFHTVQLEILEHEKALFHIVQGSTIPTFVIDRKHVITHWNSAAEKLTGYTASEMVGTNKQWLPFWQKPRPTMADIILDQTKEEEIEGFYGRKWKKSDLIEDGYEAELFFSKMGTGKWLFFTAAPIKLSDGTVVGAIETLWDTTSKRKAETQKKQYIEQLEEKEKELAQIIQGSTSPTFVINEDHLITHWNHALEKLTGFKASDMLGTNNHWKPFSINEQPIMADVILEQLKTGSKNSYDKNTWHASSLVEGGYESEAFFEKMGQKGKWLFFAAAPIKSSYDSVIGVIQTFWDVSAVKKAETERQRYTNELATLCSIYTSLNAPLLLEIRIQDAIEQIREFTKASRLCLYMSDNNGRFDLQYFNTCVAEPGISSNHFKVDADIIKQVLKIKKAVVVESDKKNVKDKETLVYIPISAKNNKIFGVMQIAKKISSFSSDDLYLLDLMGNRIGITIENSLLQEELERKSKFQSKLIRSANDGIIATDEKWKTVIFNSAAEKLFDRNTDDFLNNNDIRNFFPQKSLDILYNNAFLSKVEDPSPWCDMEIITLRGELIPVRFSGFILRDKDKMIGTVAFFQDLRKIKRLEKELVQSEKLAAVGQTVAGMAHCIKNILHGFKGGRYLMDVGTNKSDTNKINSGWKMIQRNINRTSDLVMDLLSYSKVREPEIEKCDPNEIVNDVYELLIGGASEQGVKLKKAYSSDIGQIFLDSRTVHRCMMNLVTNAIDACLFDSEINKEHYVLLKTAVGLDKVIEFSVEDNGCGMSDEVQSKLFSSLFSTKGVKGTGLGLLVTAKLVEEHNGSISVMSKEGEGTVFTIKIPFNFGCF